MKVIPLIPQTAYENCPTSECGRLRRSIYTLELLMDQRWRRERARLSPSLIQTLCEHASGNPRSLMTMANDLVVAASPQEREVIDEKLHFEDLALDHKAVNKP